MKKRMLSLFLALACALVSALPVSAETAAYSFEKLKKYTDTVEPWVDTPVSVLNANVSVKKPLATESGDFLVIPRGKTLRLKNGAELSGNIYVENGGSLIFEGGLSLVRGTIVSDGTIAVYTGSEARYGGARVTVFGALYVSERGQIVEREGGGTLSTEVLGRIGTADGGSVVCLGKTNSALPELTAKPVAAVLGRRSYGELQEYETVTDSIERLYPDPEKYFRGEEVPAGGSTRSLTVLFENGSVLRADAIYSDENRDGGDYMEIFGLNVRFALLALDSVQK